MTAFNGPAGHKLKLENILIAEFFFLRPKVQSLGIA